MLIKIINGPCGDTSGCHQYSPGFIGPVGFPVGVPLVWKEGLSTDCEVVRSANERAKIVKNFIRVEMWTAPSEQTG